MTILWYALLSSYVELFTTQKSLLIVSRCYFFLRMYAGLFMSWKVIADYHPQCYGPRMYVNVSVIWKVISDYAAVAFFHKAVRGLSYELENNCWSCRCGIETPGCMWTCLWSRELLLTVLPLHMQYVRGLIHWLGSRCSLFHHSMESSGCKWCRPFAVK
jgi:hypothetical protein